MNFVSSRHFSRPVPRFSCLLSALGVALAAAVVIGCGGSSGSGSPVRFLSGNTAVVVLASSTANDQISVFNMTLSSLTLTSQSGKTVTVFSTPQSAEYMHLNGSAEPLTTVSVPQDVYTSATATFGNGPYPFPICVAQNTAAHELLTNGSIASFSTPPDVTVNLPAPIAVIGASMGLVLDLQVSKSVSSFSCVPATNGAASITPTFNLTPVVIAAQPTNSTNGKATGLYGLISTVSSGGTSFSVTGADGPKWQVSSSSGTVFQGVTGASQLAAGMPVDMDVAIQPDGSLLATRVAVYDTNATSLTLVKGPVIQMAGSQPTLFVLSAEYEGPLLAGLGSSSPIPFNFGNTVFQTSGQLTNVQSLPFTASFKATNMVDGQNVFVSTHALTISGGPAYQPATTMTLLPQTIDGTVSAVSSSGNFTAYTVTLAPYDLFTDLAVQAGQTTLLNHPNSVVVYADSNTTQLLNTTPMDVGSVLRFSGLVFNDHGTLRMDCAQIDDGVAE
ncbi:MAG: DUF5666 domain-containing protein [Acidobacteriaceae bacterium]